MYTFSSFSGAMYSPGGKRGGRGRPFSEEGGNGLDEEDEPPHEVQA